MEAPAPDKRQHDLLEKVQARANVIYPRNSRVSSSDWWRAILKAAGEPMPEDSALYFDENLTYRQLLNIWLHLLSHDLEIREKWEAWVNRTFPEKVEEFPASEGSMV